MTAPAEALRPFETIIGRWKTSGSVLDEHGAPVTTINGTDEYEWMVGGHWVIHRVDVMMGEDHVQALELIGEYDDETNSYSMRAFDGSSMTALWERELDNGPGRWTRWMEMHFDPIS